MRTGNIGAFRLTNVASAYYKGDERTRSSSASTAPPSRTRPQLDEYFAMLEEAKKRDHRKLGKELELFTFDDDVGPGFAALAAARRRHHRRTGEARRRRRSSPPAISACGRRTSCARKAVYLTSGHLPYYADSMFPPMRSVSKESDRSTSTELQAGVERVGAKPSSWLREAILANCKKRTTATAFAETFLKIVSATVRRTERGSANGKRGLIDESRCGYVPREMSDMRTIAITSKR